MVRRRIDAASEVSPDLRAAAGARVWETGSAVMHPMGPLSRSASPACMAQAAPSVRGSRLTATCSVTVSSASPRGTLRIRPRSLFPVSVEVPIICGIERSFARIIGWAQRKVLKR